MDTLVFCLLQGEDALEKAQLHRLDQEGGWSECERRR